MSNLCFELATESDDAALRKRMAEDWLPGSISVSFRREPSFFYASAVQGESAQIIKCTDTASGQLVGLASRYISPVYINGKSQRIGYLADLRGHADYRGKRGLFKGYRYLHSLHQLDPVTLYTSMILEDNLLAREVLTSERCGLPRYNDIGRFMTPAIYLDLPKKPLAITGITFRKAREDDLLSLFAFIEQHAAEKQFAPVITLKDFNSPRLRDLKIEDFYLALSGKNIVGVIAAWDQGAYRQTYVEKLSKPLAFIRPLYNSLAKFSALKPIPAAGTKVPYFYLAFITIQNNDKEIFHALLRYLYNDRQKGRWHYFIAGLHETDPLTKALEEYRRIDIAGRLYVVHYAENQSAYEQLDKRIPYVEIAMI